MRESRLTKHYWIGVFFKRKMKTEALFPTGIALAVLVVLRRDRSNSNGKISGYIVLKFHKASSNI